MAHPTLSGIITEHPSHMWVIKPGGRVIRGRISRIKAEASPNDPLDELAKEVLTTLGDSGNVMAFGVWVDDGQTFEVVALEALFLCRN